MMKYATVPLPSSRAFPIEDVIKAARYYFKKTGRRVTFEYILIKDVNSSLENAEELHRLLGDLNCHINLNCYQRHRTH